MDGAVAASEENHKEDDPREGADGANAAEGHTAGRLAGGTAIVATGRADKATSDDVEQEGGDAKANGPPHGEGPVTRCFVEGLGTNGCRF